MSDQENDREALLEALRVRVEQGPIWLPRDAAIEILQCRGPGAGPDVEEPEPPGAAEITREQRPCSDCHAERGELHEEDCPTGKRRLAECLAAGWWWCACGSLRPPGEDPCLVCSMPAWVRSGTRLQGQRGEPYAGEAGRITNTEPQGWITVTLEPSERVVHCGWDIFTSIWGPADQKGDDGTVGNGTERQPQGASASNEDPDCTSDARVSSSPDKKDST